jgi:hypothetical protein
MYTLHYVRPATDRDADALQRLAALDSAAPLQGQVIVSEENGVLIAARSLADGRTVADPFRFTLTAREELRSVARTMGARTARPSLRSRLQAVAAPLRLAAPAH